MSSYEALVRSLSSSQRRIAASFISWTDTSASSPPRTSAPSSKSFRTRSVTVRKPNSEKRLRMVVVSACARHRVSAKVNDSMASIRIVASILENSASSFPSLSRPTMRGVRPSSLNCPSSFARALYIFSMVPNFEIKIVPVFSPIPTIPGMLSDGSPRRPL